MMQEEKLNFRHISSNLDTRLSFKGKELSASFNKHYIKLLDYTLTNAGFINQAYWIAWTINAFFLTWV